MGLGHRFMSDQEQNQNNIGISLNIVDKNIELFLELQGNLILGRSYPHTSHFSGVDLTAFDAYSLEVSRNHAFLKYENDQLILIDNNSAHGTYLNEERLKPMKPYKVQVNDQICLGSLELVVTLIDS